MAVNNGVDFGATPASAQMSMRSKPVTHSNGVVVRKSSIRKLPNISSGGEKIIRFPLFEFVLRVFFAEDFGIRIDEILLKRHFFNMLLLFLRDVWGPVYMEKSCPG